MLLQEAIGAGIYLLFFGTSMVITFSFVFYLVFSRLFSLGRFGNTGRIAMLTVLSILFAIFTTIMLLWAFFGSVTYS